MTSARDIPFSEWCRCNLLLIERFVGLHEFARNNRPWHNHRNPRKSVPILLFSRWRRIIYQCEGVRRSCPSLDMSQWPDFQKLNDRRGWFEHIFTAVLGHLHLLFFRPPERSILSSHREDVEQVCFFQTFFPRKMRLSRSLNDPPSILVTLTRKNVTPYVRNDRHNWVYFNLASSSPRPWYFLCSCDEKALAKNSFKGTTVLGWFSFPHIWFSCILSAGNLWH